MNESEDLLLVLIMFGGFVAGYFILSKIIDAVKQKRRPPSTSLNGNEAQTGPGEQSSHSHLHLITMAGKLAMMDGEISSAETDMIRTHIQKSLTTDVMLQAKLMDLFGKAHQQPASYEYHAEGFYNLNRQDTNQLEQAVRFLFQLAMADGVLHEQEEKFIRKTCLIFHLPQSIWMDEPPTSF